MKLWIDDTRVAPVGWYWAKKYGEAIAALRTVKFEEISFDHDLGYEPAAAGLDPLDVVGHFYDRVELTGYDVMLWVVEHDAWPTVACGCHSMNPVGRTAICATIERYGPYVYKENVTYDDAGFPLSAVRYSKET